MHHVTQRHQRAVQVGNGLDLVFTLEQTHVDEERVRKALELKEDQLKAFFIKTSTASCVAILTEASSLNMEDTFRKAKTTFFGLEAGRFLTRLFYCQPPGKT